MKYYEIYVGSRSVRVCETLGEVYRIIKDIHAECLYHQLRPLFHLKDLKTEHEFTASYVLFNLDGKLYIQPLKAVRKEI